MIEVIAPSRCYWELCGSPHVELAKSVDGGHCAICSSPLLGRGVELSKAGMTFLNQTTMRMPTSSWICEPCVFSTRWVCPPGRSAKARDDGTEGRGPNPAMYGHFWHRRADGSVDYINGSKGDKPAILAWLRAPKEGPWWATISDSGKKHTIPWAPINPPDAARPKLLMDELVVTIGDWRLVDDMRELLTAGATKDSLGRGEYNVGEYERCAEQIQAFEAAWGERHRGGAWFTCALWLAQRDEQAVAERMAQEREVTKAKKQAAADKAKALKAKKALDKKPPKPSKAAQPSKTTTASKSKKTSKTKGGQTGERAGQGKAEDVAGGISPHRTEAVRPDDGVQSTEAMGHAVQPNEGGGKDVGKRRRVGDKPAAPPASGGAGSLQLGLFD